MTTSRTSHHVSIAGGFGDHWERVRGLLAVLLAMVMLFGALSGHFATRLTFATIANQIPDLTVISVGMTFVLIIAGIDLSVGSVMALGGAVLGVAVVDWGWPLPLAAALAVFAGLGCGLVNGFVSVRWSIPSFIVTLGMLEIARGGAYLATNSQTKYIGAAIASVGSPIAHVGLSPAFLVAVAVASRVSFLLSRTVFGRYIGGYRHE